MGVLSVSVVLAASWLLVVKLSPSSPSELSRTEQDLAQPGRTSARLLLLDGERGSPIQGATLHDRTRSESQRSVSDVDGTASVELSDQGIGQARIDSEGYASSAVYLSPEQTHPASLTRVHLWRSASLTVELPFDKRQGVADAQRDVVVSVVERDQQELFGGYVPPTIGVPADLTVRRMTTAPGVVVFDGLPAYTPLRLELWRGSQIVGAEPRTISLAPGAAATVVLPEHSCRVRGRLIDVRGEPVVNREIWLLRAGRSTSLTLDAYDARMLVASTRARSDGFFEFSSIPPGKWRIGPPLSQFRGWSDPSDSTAAVWPVAIVVTEGTQFVEVDVKISAAATVRGNVRGWAQSSPPPEFFVQAISPDFESSAVSDSSGAFCVDVLPDLKYQIRAWPITPGYCFPSQPVQVTAPSIVDLELPRSASIRGKIIDTRSNQAVWALFVCSVAANGSYEELGGYTREDGAFLVKQIPDGEYAISARTLDGMVSGLIRGHTADLGDEMSLRVLLRPSGCVRARVSNDAPGGDFRLTQDGHLIGGGTILTGQLCEFYVPPETVHWSFESANSRIGGELIVRENSVSDIVIDTR